MRIRRGDCEKNTVADHAAELLTVGSSRSIPKAKQLDHSRTHERVIMRRRGYVLSGFRKKHNAPSDG